MPETHIRKPLKKPMQKALWMVLPLLLAACGQNKNTTLNVLAGSELKDLTSIFDAMQKETGITLNLQYVGTLDGVEKITTGDPADLAWFSHGKYLNLVARNKVVQQERIMLSPVVLGVKHSKAQAWGWLNKDKPVTWDDIAQKASTGELKFAMTNPSASNSGFTALMGLNAALKDKNALKDFFKGQALTAGSSGWLSDAFVQDQGKLDGMVNYESVILSLNQSGKLTERLDPIYPQEGIVTADYPLMLLNKDQQASYQKVVDYLKQPDVQRKIMELTLRRPASTDVPLSSIFPNALLVELPFPATAAEVQNILASYFSEQRKPAHAIFVLDVSGSMGGDRLSNLKSSISNLAGQDTSLTGRYASFQNREKVTFIPFNSYTLPEKTFLIQSKQDNFEIQNYINGLQADGGTGIYSALRAAYDLAGREMQADPNRTYTIVVMSDGENNSGLDLSGFENTFQMYPADLRQVRTFPILFGESDDQDMNRLASDTGGKVFNGRDSLAKVFKEIRSYQ
ncbi:substrate-binding and vWA domain-containing protein [Deinococcus roseus]|uniref:VWA domain-containing protein n=1 Tax=Deinococcus roseus TaxID=392414 RepID=A0ABQ2CXK6_9DEIO|nr:VWA domain-containing protein [Deinococcus roseus]GGJ26568.1 VWA domain-containing protein [Deinococcus roseus]